MTTSKKQLWTTEIQMHYPQITAVVLSPDGEHVVYTVNEALMTDEESKFITHLYLATTTNSAPIQLTYGEHSSRAPKWSPDGRFIAFLSDRAGKNNLYVMRAAGGEAWPLTAYEKTSIVTFAWSPDGQSLAFLMAQPPSEEKQAAQKAKDDTILWDVDFDFVHLFRIPFTIGPRELAEAIQLTQGRFHIIGFDWLRDGQSLVLAHQPTPVAEDWTKTHLATVPARLAENGVAYDADALTDVALVASWGDAPQVSPDGKWIAHITSEQPPQWGMANRVGLYPVDGGEPRLLAAVPNAHCWIIGWSADSQHVYAGETNGLDTFVWALPISGAQAVPIRNDATFKWSLHTATNSALAFSAETFTQPNAVYVYNIATHKTQQVATPPLPTDWPDAPLPKAEVFTWQSFDGTEIEGILTYPLDYEAGQRYPLIVEVHGGPMGVFNRRFFGWPGRYCDVAVAAERGFCVLRANVRGSSGYGKDFRFANYGDWGQGDFQDILAGIDAVIKQGIVDPDRLGIMGWSYGGYMTSWAITQTDRFKAACVGAGVTNLMSFNGTSDIPGFIPDYFDSEFWDNLAPYRNHSALFHTQGVTTPTLIQHGKDDVRVPLSQGRELYNALKRQGVPVEMVIYPRQGHAINEPRLRSDMRRRPIEWFERWL